MNDNISRAELFDRLATITAEDANEMKAKIYAVIQEMETVPPKVIAQVQIDTDELIAKIKEDYGLTDGWIPCSERLPDLHKEHYTVFGNDEYFKISSPVLVYRTGEDIEEEERIQVAQYEEDSFLRTFWETTDAEILTGVIAWMPLPDPYESEEESE